MIRINLAPRGDKHGRRGAWFASPRINLGFLFVPVALALAAGLGWGWWHLARTERHLTAEIEAGARELAGLRATVGQSGDIRERLAELEARLKAIQLLTRDQRRPLLLIDAFADAVPADVWITALEDKGVTLRVSGSAFSAAPVANFMAALRASGRFKEVDIVISKQDLTKTPSVVSFEVTCRFEG
jgi:Tfp pilus assembly protein PilN